MKRALSSMTATIYYYKDEKKIEGKHENITGNVTWLRGDVDDCTLTNKEREKGVDVKDLIKK